MKKIILFLLSWLAITPVAFPMAMALELEPALKDADLVAHVKIVSVADAPADSGFRQLARATITDSAKGPKAGEHIELLSDNGNICPNVLYAAGDDCVVFAKRNKSGHFQTMNTYAGQFRIENGTTECYMLSRLDPKRYLGTREEVLANMNRKYSAKELMAEFRRRLASPAK